MATYSKKETRWQFYLLFFAFLGISLLFLVPQFRDNLNGREWIGVDVEPAGKDILPGKDSVLITNISGNSRLVDKSRLQLEVDPGAGWGFYFFLQNIFSFVLVFIGLWYLLKFSKALQSEDRFENSTSVFILRLGQLLIFSGIISYLNRLFLNYYLLEKLGFEGYASKESYIELAAIGLFLVYISKFYKKGMQLQQETDLTV